MSGALNPFDLFVLIVLVLSTFWGGIRGIVSQATSIFSWLASAYIATHYYFIVAKFMNESYAYYKPLAMIVTFIASALLIRIASNIVKNMVSLAGLKEFDRQMGAALGLLKGALLCLLVTFVFIIFNGSTRSIVENSNTGPYFAAFISKIQRHLPESELTRRFLAYADAIEEEKKQEEADGTESKSISTEVRELKKYLVSKVLSDAASDIVAEAEENGAEGSEGGINSFFQSATSSVNRLNNQLKEAISHGLSSGESSTVSDLSTDAGRNDVGLDYGEREYGDYAKSESALSADRSSRLDNTLLPDSASSFDDALNGVSDAFKGWASSVSSDVQNVVTDQTASLREDMTELDAFFKSIGGGYGTGHRSWENSDNVSSQQNRSGTSRSLDSNASRSRLNSRTYTIESSSMNY